MVNHKEFFSELSVTFLADAYHEYDEERMQMESCCPPLMAPTVVERVRGKSKEYSVFCVDEGSVHSDSSLAPLIAPEKSLDGVVSNENRPVVDSFLGVWQLLERRESELMRTKVPHCNKFYPFTKGQFKRHDPELYAVYADLWSQIEAWRDRENETCCLRLLRNCWPK